MAETAARVEQLIGRELYTVKQFIKPGRWPSESALRALILDAAWGKNNFQKAFVRINRRVCVDPLEFWKAVDAMQEGQHAEST